MTRVAVPEMKRFNYADSLATGSVAAGGIIGILIPPSVVMVLYGVLTQTSIGDLFIAGLLPGLLTIVGFMIVEDAFCNERLHLVMRQTSALFGNFECHSSFPFSS